jgi:hypothetical protein
LVQGHYFFGGAQLYRLLWHAVNDAGRLILSDGSGTVLPHCQQSLCAVGSHSGHEDANGVWSGGVGYRVEENIDAWPLEVNRRPVFHSNIVSCTAFLQDQMFISGSYQCNTRHHGIIVLGFSDLHWAYVVQPFLQRRR